MSFSFFVDGSDSHSNPVSLPILGPCDILYLFLIFFFLWLDDRYLYGNEGHVGNSCHSSESTGHSRFDFGLYVDEFLIP